MPPSDLDIARTAHQWIALHGDAATAKARAMVEAMRRTGDADGAGAWLRIIAAITTLGDPPTEARQFALTRGRRSERTPAEDRA